MDDEYSLEESNISATLDQKFKWTKRYSPWNIEDDNSAKAAYGKDYT